MRPSLQRERSSTPWLRQGGLLLALLAASSPAWSQPSNSDLLMAEALYKEGKSLFEKEHYAEACPKLADSQRLDPGGGTLLLLALCHQKEGKIASAWVEFKEALANAKRDKRDDRAKLARQHLAEIEPRIPTIQIKIDPAAMEAARATLLLDDRPLSTSILSVPLPVDPGERIFELKAPGKQPLRRSIRVAPGEHPALTLPSPAELPDLPPSPSASASAASASSASAPPPTAPSTPPTAAPRERPLRTTPIVLGAVGVVGLGLGAYWGLDAISLAKSANEACPSRRCASQPATDDSKKADQSATLSNVAFAVGGAALVAGVALHFLLPIPEPTSGRKNSVQLAVSPGDVRFSLGGAF